MAKIFSQARTKLIFILIVLLTAVAVSFFLLPEKSTDSMDTKPFTPTLFVHGFKGGPGSFNTLLERFAQNNWGSKGLVFHVSSSGALHTEGNLGKKKNPFIQIIFEDNRASLKQQTMWLQHVMHTLGKTYDVKQVNLVGHSMGGLTTAKYLWKERSPSYPDVEKLVVIGSPFYGIKRDSYFEVNHGAALQDLKPGAASVQTMFEHKRAFPHNLGVLAIAGSPFYRKTDGVVSVRSALGIQELVPPSIYHEKIFTDLKATHSGLHEHSGVDRKIAEFLWGTKENS
ncbi:alpha/beta fold hydrolase [Salibacterium aidingense]|uniref:alpha/beta fold hydrolase n=1 Tax=Salibacterium aidingense TaxID=384933 RepID=UPI0003FCD192|nr:alpha/beta fold hydrolase [Salibacterium aidingense]